MSKIIMTTLEKICLSEKGAIISGPFGSNISSKYFVEKGIPVIRGNNLSLGFDKFYDDGFVYVTKEKADELKCYAYRDDLIFTAAGTIGQVGIIPRNSKYTEYVISNKQIRARIDTTKLDVLYAYYWFSSSWIRELLIKNNKGSTVPLLSLSEVKNLPIFYPDSIDEQRRIVYCIDVISKKIENNNHISRQLEHIAKTIYDYWFLQFDFPDESGNPYRQSGGKMVWNKKLNREIPEGWDVMLFRDILTFLKGRIPKEISNIQTEILNSPYITIDVANNATPQFCNERNMIKCNGETIMVMDGAASGDIYIGNYGSLGSTFAMLSSLREDISDSMIYMLLQEKMPVYKKANTGSTVPHANRSFIENMKIAIPKSCKLFSKEFDSVFAKIKQLRDENQQLISLRDFLLPVLMNGQARVV